MYGPSTLANVLLINANTSTVRGLALHGAASTVQASNVTALVIENNLIGTTAFVIADPTLTLANSASNYGVRLGEEPSAWQYGITLWAIAATAGFIYHRAVRWRAVMFCWCEMS